MRGSSLGGTYNLPAYMVFALKNCSKPESASVDAVIWALARAPSNIESEWPLFNETQRAAIATFLKFMVLVAGEQNVDSWQASLAYEQIWSKYEIS